MGVRAPPQSPWRGSEPQHMSTLVGGSVFHLFTDCGAGAAGRAGRLLSAGTPLFLCLRSSAPRERTETLMLQRLGERGLPRPGLTWEQPQSAKLSRTGVFPGPCDTPL